MTTVTVYKNDHLGQPIWRYDGQIVARGHKWVCLQARFGRHDVDIGVMIFRRGDLMTEWFYADRCYNIFQIQDVDDNRIKGWYCNITRPASITEDTITADDLALDVFVSPTGEITLLDEDELTALNLSSPELDRVWDAVNRIKRRVEQREAPFDVIFSS